MSSRDSALRAITDDGAFRVMTVRTTETVRASAAAQRATGPVAGVYAELLTGAILVRETMAPDLRVQAILQGRNRKSRMVADVHPGGDTRGLVQLAQGDPELALGDGAVLQMMRTLNDGSLHQGIVEVPEQGGVSAGLMRYMQASEQVVSMIAVGCVLEAGELTGAAGYIVQLLPEVAPGPLMVMTERLADFESIDRLIRRGAAEPDVLLGELLHGMAYTQVGSTPLRFHCPCSAARVAASLATLPRADIEEFITDRRMLDIECDYCGKDYHIAPETLRGLLDAS